MRRFLLLVVVALGLAAEAQAYPAVSTALWKRNELGNLACGKQAASGFDYGSAEEACQSANAAKAAEQYLGGCGGGAGSTVVGVGSQVTPTPLTYECRFNLQWNGSPYASNVAVGGGVTQGSAQLTCPNGGALSGSSCVCGPGETDTGSACTVPACPTGQYRPTDQSECTAMCPEDSYQGDAEFKSGAATFCVTRRSFAFGVGWTQTTGYGVEEIRCEARPTGMVTVCEGASCYNEHVRLTGSQCIASPVEGPANDPTQCAAGDKWCLDNGNGCAAGFVGGTFNGKSLCVAEGEPVSAVPQPQSPLNPPTYKDSTTPATQFPSDNGSTGDGEKTKPGERSVIGIGNVSVTIGSGGSGSGTEDGECGFAPNPPCKIDETGTPSGDGALSGALSSLNGVVGGLGTLGDGIASGEGKDTGWKIGFNAPTGCTNPPAMTLPGGINLVADLCAWEPQISAVMSFLWYLLTVGSCLAMIRSSLAGGV